MWASQSRNGGRGGRSAGNGQEQHTSSNRTSGESAKLHMSDGSSIGTLLNCQPFQGAARRALMQGRSLRALGCLRGLPMNIITSTRQVGGVTIVDISGRIVLGEESAALRDEVLDLLSKGHKQILLNLADVDQIDSMGLGALVSAFASVRKQGGELKLLNLTDKAADLMQVTKLYTIFDIVNDEAAGVKSFGQSTAATA